MSRMVFNSSGISFRTAESEEAAQARPKGMCLVSLDPTNKFAKHPRGAFPITWEGIGIGFVPDKSKDIQDEIVRLIDAGETPHLEVEDYSCTTGTGKSKVFNRNGEGVLGSVTIALCSGGDGNLREHEGQTYGRISHFVGCFWPGSREGLDRWMINSFKSFDAYTAWMKDAADKGTAMHTALENYFKEGTVDPENLPEALGEFTAKYKVEPISFEERVYDDALMLSGQYDMLARVDGAKTVIDWKSSKEVRLKHKMQSCFYSHNVGPDVQAMVVAFGRGLQTWIGSPTKVKYGYGVCALLKRATTGSEML